MALAGWLLALAVAVNTAAGGEKSIALPPVYRIEATNLYDAGLQHGRLAGDRIAAWAKSDEIVALLAFARGPGRSEFEAMRLINADTYPQYADEIRGIADGAKLDLDLIWALNLMVEIEAIMPANSTKLVAQHCSDFYAISPSGYAGGFAQGHNEDWPGPISSLWYFVDYVALPGAGFGSCTGMAYPGTLIGWASTWNPSGMFLTQNSLYPRETRAGGVGSAFIQRQAICGPESSLGMDSVIAGLVAKTWNYGASVNLVDLPARRMANVEVSGERYAVKEVTEQMGNYSHFNMYKTIDPGQIDAPYDSSVHRQARADELPPPRNFQDVVAALSDTADAAFPIFRDETLATLIVDGATGRLDAWCCGHSAASGPAAWTWHLPTTRPLPSPASSPSSSSVVVFA